MMETSNTSGSSVANAFPMNPVEYGVSSAQTHEIKKKDDSASTVPSFKYRHVAAVHSKVRTACLSHDSETSPSFLGFRNLMVIVLSENYC